MDEIYSIENIFLKIEVRKKGAELCAIKKLPEGTDHMWNANPEVWAGYAPVLFPIIGALKDDCYFFKGEKYSLPRHGFLRNNANVELSNITDNCLTFSLSSSPETLMQFPFQFEFLISYTLEKNSLVVNHQVKNLGNEDMFFSLGGHPAFKCPLNANEKYSDYHLEFSHIETAYTYQIDSAGLIGGKTDLILDNSNTIPLHYNLFDKGALVFKTLKSRNVSLVSRLSGKHVQVDYEGFPYLGIWAKPNADYVCIEPWLGIADSVDTDQNLETKEGIIRISGNSNFSAGYAIRIF